MPKRIPVVRFKDEASKPVRRQIQCVSFLPPEVKLLEEKGGQVINIKKLLGTDEEPDPLPKGAREVLGDQPPEKWQGLTSQLTRASCAFTAQELLQGPPEPPYNGRFFIGDHHIEWDNLVTTKDRLCILSPRDSGKCLRYQDEIQAANGDLVKAGEWRGGELVAWDEFNKRYVPAYSPPAVENGVKPIYEIRTATGRVIGVTREHPLLQYQGWVKAKDISVGDRVAVMNGLPSLGTESVEFPYQCGALLGAKNRNGPLPPEVFRLHDLDLAEYIAGYISKVGSIRRATNRAGTIRIEADNIKFVQDLQTLFSRLGFYGTVGETVAHNWYVSIGTAGVEEFHKKITLRGYKEDQVQDMCRAIYYQGPASTSDTDRFTRVVWKDLKQTSGWHLRHHGYNPKREFDPSRKIVRYMAEQEENEELLARVSEPLFWDKVVSVEVKEPEMTYAIQVPKYHTFIASGLINHNTYFFDFAYPIWKIINNPKCVGFIFSATQPMAERILGDIKAELENNPKLSWLVPKKKEHWRASSIQCANGHKIYAKGFGTKVRGAHPKWIVVDDGLTDETAYSELVRKKQIEYFYTAITNMIVPGGQIIVVGTPFAKEDLYGNLQKNPEYTFAKYQAVVNNKPLWPERYDLKALEKRKREIGSVRFAREFLCCMENTFVETESGPKYIQDIMVGEKVLTHENKWQEVTKTFERDYNGVLIQIGSCLTVTPNHPIYTQRGWVDANKLSEYDVILYLTFQLNGEFKFNYTRVERLKRVFYEGKVYNLEVANDNSYFAEGIAVHNCNPIDDSSSFFPKRLFKGDPVEQYAVKLGMSREYWEEKGVTIFMGVDFAMSTSVQADYSVVWVMGKDVHGNRWIIDIKRGKGMAFQEQLSMINAIGHKYQPALIHLEANQMQRIFGDELIRTSDLPIRQFVTGIQKHSLTIGLPSMRILLENQKFRIPRGDRSSILATDEWIDELANFTFENDKLESVGAHDDLAMASWICNEAIRIGSFQFSFGPNEKEADEHESFQVAELLTREKKVAESLNRGKGAGKGTSVRGNGNGSNGGSGSTTANLVGEEHTLPSMPRWY